MKKSPTEVRHTLKIHQKIRNRNPEDEARILRAKRAIDRARGAVIESVFDPATGKTEHTYTKQPSVVF